MIVADAPPMPDEDLLMKCYEDENERRHGTGIRTDVQVSDYRKKKAKEREEAAASVVAKELQQKSKPETVAAGN
jgi:hypothetical protein